MRRLHVALGLALATTTACNDYYFYKKYPERIKEASKIVPAAKPTPADILFIVDNSGSMADDQDNIARNFNAFITEIAGAGDYQIAVVTTDVDSPNGEKQGKREYVFKTTSPFRVDLAQSSETGCMPTGIEHGCFRGPDAATRIIKSQVHNRDQQITLFQQNVLVGSCGSGAERGLEAIKLALQKTGAGGCNAGFLRDNANLVIVLITDEEDYDAENGSAPTIATYLNELSKYKQPSQLRFGGIIGSIGNDATRCKIAANGQPAECGGLCRTKPTRPMGAMCNNMPNACGPEEYCSNDTQCVHQDLQFFDQYCFWCSYFNDPDCCSAIGGKHYLDFAKALEGQISNAIPSIKTSGCRPAEGARAGCLVDSICQKEFNKTLARIARDLVLSNEYILDPPASYPPGVVVKVNGDKLTYGTDYDVSTDGKTVTIKGAKTPKGADVVEIFFVIKE